MTKIYSLSLLALLSLSVGCGGGATGSVAATSDAVAAAASTLLTCYNNTLGAAASLTFTIPTAAQISAACSSDEITKMANSLACAIDAKPSFCELTAAWNVTPDGSRAEEVALAAITQLGNKCHVEGVSPNCQRLFLQ